MPTEVKGTKTVKNPTSQSTGILGGNLPMTGSNIIKTAAIGASLIAAGTAMQAVKRNTEVAPESGEPDTGESVPS